MDVGMLWYDNGPAKLRDRVERAAEYYADKYGHEPNLCLVNPEMLKGETSKFNGVLVRPASAVMVDHFWLGVEERGKSNGQSAAAGRTESKSAAKSGSKKGKSKSGSKQGKSKSGTKASKAKKAD